MGLHISVGELRVLLDAVAKRGQAAYDALKAEIRGSPVVQADQTSWWEDGQHGYVWAFLTPTVRYFERHGTRSGQVPKDVLGGDFTGIVVSDGYKGYDPLPCEKQRCWVHLLCQQHRLAFQQRMLAQATPHRQAAVKAWANLATYLIAYVTELFVFLQHPAVPSHNNAAEQAVRGPVTRKISGGTRSAQGSQTKMVLFSLLDTCVLRGREPITAMEQMLLGHPLFTVPTP